MGEASDSLLTIVEQRRKIVRRLAKSPSLQNELNALMTDAYGDAILSAARETGLNEEIFPKQCPWSFEQTINNEFFPE